MDLALSKNKKIYGEVINRNILKYIKKRSTVLDVGCGSGAIAEQLVQLECKVYGIEISEDAARKAKERMEDVIVADIENIVRLPWGEKFFDIIILADVLEHFKKPLDVLIKLKPYLRKDGIFIISLPNIAFWRIRLSLLLGRFNYTPEGGIMDETHLRFYTFSSARRLIHEAGLEIVEENITIPASYESHSDFLKIYLKKLLPTLLSHGMIFVCRKGIT